MPRAPREKSESGIYHIMIRGANRQEIFHDEEDRLRFLETLKRYMTKVDMKVYGWCLMDNHIHLLLSEGKEEISITMKRIGVSFVWYYNRKYKTTGHLFQDRFQSEKVETDEYILTVIRYIHQNPVKANLVKRVHDWEWSSCIGYYGKTINPPGLLDSDFVLKMFAGDRDIAVAAFKEFNEQVNDDECLDQIVEKEVLLSDTEAREKIINTIGKVQLAQIKSFPKAKRDELIRKVKGIKGISQRQAARIMGISPNLIFKA
jgi:REP element-mobilizing transposase RayT